MLPPPVQPPASPALSRRHWALALLPAIALAVPLALRPVSARLTADAPPSYVPSLEATRVRRAFDPTFREDLRRIQPRYVLIGDSMLGARIDPRHLTRVIQQQAWWVMQPGTGSAYWYLALKNVVLGAGLKPKVVFVFFRDFNLTDVLFRLDEQFRWSVDTLAGPIEPELDRAIASRLDGPWYRRATGTRCRLRIPPGARCRRRRRYAPGRRARSPAPAVRRRSSSTSTPRSRSTD